MNKLFTSRRQFVKAAFIVKTSGGIASQLMALISAVYVSQKIGRPFKIQHYPHSTGGYYPLAIQKFLANDEVLNPTKKIRGLGDFVEIPAGSIIESHPLIQKKFSYLKIVQLLTKYRLDLVLNLFRLEWQIDTSTQRLKRCPKIIRSISGGYPPYFDEGVKLEIYRRFRLAGFAWPVTHSSGVSKKIVIHYRLADRRTAFSKPGIGGAVNAIVDPTSFKTILENLQGLTDFTVTVVSDEPIVAKNLLSEVGIKAEIEGMGNDLWEDMMVMGSADILICPWSTVSQLMATLLNDEPQKEVYYPEFPGAPQKIKWKLDGVTYYRAKFLPESHSVYLDSYISPANKNKEYPV
jgi:hypothetical protein